MSRAHQLVMILCCLLAGCAGHSNFNRAAFHTLNVVDAAQTMEGMDRGCTEGNPLLGDNPSDGKIAAFAVLQSLLFEWVDKKAQEHGESLVWERVAIAFKFVGVAANANTLSKGCKR